MTNELATRGPLTADIETVMIGGDLKRSSQRRA